MKRYLVFSLTCILFFFEPSLAKDNTELLLVQILYRHGDRTPITLYPNDPNPESVWPEGLSQLTLLGRKQHYALGKYFRSMYKDFTTFSPLEIDVVSSFADRCVMSAETNLASFFAPDPKWAFEDNFNWQPIPVRYLPKADDKYLETESDCPRADAEERRVLNSPEGQQFMAEHKEMYKNLTVLSGKDLANWTEASYFHDVIFIEKRYNLTTPKWVEPFWDELTNVTNLSFYWSFNSPLLHRLRAGPFLQRIIKNMNKKIEGDLKNLKFKIFSAHDTTLAVVLGALNLYNFVQPPYASSLIFELHQMPDGQKAVRLLYLNSTRPEEKIDPPHVLTLDGCTEFCPLDYVVNYTRDLMPGDWEQECELDKSLVDKIAEKQVAVGWFFVFIAVAIVALCGYSIWRIYSRRQDKKKGVSPVNYNSLDSS